MSKAIVVIMLVVIGFMAARGISARLNGLLNNQAANLAAITKGE